MNKNYVFKNVTASQIRWYAYWIEGREEPYFTPIIEGFPEDALAEVFKGAEAVKLLPEEVRPFDFRYFAHKSKDEDWDSILQRMKRTIEFEAGYYEWNLFIDDEIVYVFQADITDFFEEGMTFTECKDICKWLLDISIEHSLEGFEEQGETWNRLWDIELDEQEYDYITTIMADRMYHDYAAA